MQPSSPLSFSCSPTGSPLFTPAGRGRICLFCMAARRLQWRTIRCCSGRPDWAGQAWISSCRRGRPGSPGFSRFRTIFSPRHRSPVPPSTGQSGRNCGTAPPLLFLFCPATCCSPFLPTPWAGGTAMRALPWMPGTQRRLYASDRPPPW